MIRGCLLVTLALLFRAGDRAPAPISLEAVLADRRAPVLLVFFATGCPVCFEDLLDMIHLVDREKLPVRVVGICGDPENDILEFADRYAVRVPLIRDERGRIRRRYKADGYPFRIVLDGGAAIYRDDPYLPLDKRRDAVRKFLAGLKVERPGRPG